MARSYPPINPSFPHMLHGADYNPDQWPEEVRHEDMGLMRLAHTNVMALGIFAWARLEPEEGRFDFDWMDQVMDMIYDNGGRVILATPSGARPAWMSQKYPEVLRVRPDRGRNLHGVRHNHCMSSPVYREKTRIMNGKLAERYKDHPGLLMWHVSNEYGGECHCELCRAGFIDWLKERYGSLDALNHAWWTAFWSHTYSDWSQIEPPSPIGESSLHGLNVDWKRYVTDRTIDFMKSEIAPLREHTPDVPVTTNFMGTYPGLNYWKFAPHLDVISWDSYPFWHQGDDVRRGSDVSFIHDIMRSLKGGKPFMLMESVPSATNWGPVAKRKRPGMHLLSSLQAVAHGSDTVQYFQWRKSRGSFEKFHGAVVDHVGHEHTRVFRDVSEVGEVLEGLDDLVGTTVEPEVALIYDWENKWALDDAKGPRSGDKGYRELCFRHYHAFRQAGIPVDVIDMDQDLSRYRFVIAPMLYMIRPGVDERLAAFVAGGGTLVATFWTGIVNETDLAFLGGFPGGALRKALGIWAEEIDALYPEDQNSLVPEPGNPLGLSASYEVRNYCELVHAETAEVLGTYGSDFYAGRPALTRNAHGSGTAYTISADADDAFLRDFYRALQDETGLDRALNTELPEGVTAQLRSDGTSDYVFILNFTAEGATVDLGKTRYRDLRSGAEVGGMLALEGYGVRILRREAQYRLR